jgi:hypothetical protein
MSRIPPWLHGLDAMKNPDRLAGSDEEYWLYRCSYCLDPVEPLKGSARWGDKDLWRVFAKCSDACETLRALEGGWVDANEPGESETEEETA